LTSGEGDDVEIDAVDDAIEAAMSDDVDEVADQDDESKGFMDPDKDDEVLTDSGIGIATPRL
jgi:hypothetical protein